jgi:hypothetical protein
MNTGVMDKINQGVTDGADSTGPQTEADVHICIVRAGEPLYLPDTVNAALGLAAGGSYAVMQINGMVVIAPQGPAFSTVCQYLSNAVPCEDDGVPQLLEQLDTVRIQIAEQISERVLGN